MTEQELEINWKERGYSFDVGDIKVGDGVDRAVHDNKDELVVIVSGELEVTIDTNTFHPELGQEIFIPAKATHSLKNIGLVDSKICYGYKSIDT